MAEDVEAFDPFPITSGQRSLEVISGFRQGQWLKGIALLATRGYQLLTYGILPTRVILEL